MVSESTMVLPSFAMVMKSSPGSCCRRKRPTVRLALVAGDVELWVMETRVSAHAAALGFVGDDDLRRSGRGHGDGFRGAHVLVLLTLSGAERLSRRIDGTALRPSFHASM